MDWAQRLDLAVAEAQKRFEESSQKYQMETARRDRFQSSLDEFGQLAADKLDQPGAPASMLVAGYDEDVYEAEDLTNAGPGWLIFPGDRLFLRVVTQVLPRSPRAKA